VNITFAGTLVYDGTGEGALNHVVTLQLQYYNVAAPGLLNPVSVPLQATVRALGGGGLDYVPFTAVQTATLSTGTYSAQLLVSSGDTFDVSVSGTQSVFVVKK
jgi:hypothetical protein